MQFVGRVFTERSRVVPDYCSALFPTRGEAIEACFKARPNAQRCMVSEARYNDDLKAVVPTHYGVQWIDRPKVQPAESSWLTWLSRLAFARVP